MTVVTMERVMLALVNQGRGGGGGESLLGSIKIAVLPIVKVFTMCFLGFLMASKYVNILPASGRKLLNGLVFSLLLPCLIFSQLGQAVTLQKMLDWRISSNNFTGELPVTLAKLTTLQDFRIEDNQFSGKIPDFIQNWTSLNTLLIQGSGLSGPIPSGISLLNLTDLRISDLNGSENSAFPPLDKMNLNNLLM